MNRLWIFAFLDDGLTMREVRVTAASWAEAHSKAMDRMDRMDKTGRCLTLVCERECYPRAVPDSK